ncbi:MAG TPA: AraC family transcriptional regulator [Paenibacillaceae bacterium]
MNTILEKIQKPLVHNVNVEKQLRAFPVYMFNQCVPSHAPKSKDGPEWVGLYTKHVQPGLEINITHEGRAIYAVGKDLIAHMPRHLIMLNGDVPHQIFADSSLNYTRTVICFEHHFLKQIPFVSDLDWFAGKTHISMPLDPDTYIRMNQLIHRILEEFSELKTGWKQMVLSLLSEFMVYLERGLEAYQQNQQVLKRSKGHQLVEECCHYVRENLHEPISLSKMSELFYVSPEHLTRLFSKVKGMSFYQYVQMQRIMESVKIMESRPDLSITDVALSVGYVDSSHFIRVFKKIMGQTPSEYRKNVLRTKAAGQ